MEIGSTSNFFVCFGFKIYIFFLNLKLNIKRSRFSVMRIRFNKRFPTYTMQLFLNLVNKLIFIVLRNILIRKIIA